MDIQSAESEHKIPKKQSISLNCNKTLNQKYSKNYILLIGAENCYLWRWTI